MGSSHHHKCDASAAGRPCSCSQPCFISSPCCAFFSRALFPFFFLWSLFSPISFLDGWICQILLVFQDSLTPNRTPSCTHSPHLISLHFFHLFLLSSLSLLSFIVALPLYLLSYLCTVPSLSLCTSRRLTRLDHRRIINSNHPSLGRNKINERRVQYYAAQRTT